ncbi:hypothetical protein LINPERPRIM_LOCUS1254, partial [Linum perenne]
QILLICCLISQNLLFITSFPSLTTNLLFEHRYYPNSGNALGYKAPLSDSRAPVFVHIRASKRTSAGFCPSALRLICTSSL